MEPLGTTIGVVVALLLFTSFIKVATVLSICRYGIGLVGVEFGVVCLVVAIGLSVVASPPELRAVGIPERLFSSTSVVDNKALVDAALPFMEKRLDPVIEEHLKIRAGEGTRDIRSIAPAFILSELKLAFQIGCTLLIPLVLIDLLVAHIITLIGAVSLSAQTVALPIKLVLFIVAGGWGMLGKKLLGLE
jgi:flagellar biosynthetic protein FliP